LNNLKGVSSTSPAHRAKRSARTWRSLIDFGTPISVAESVTHSPPDAHFNRFPRTRYQGSKRKLVPVILDELSEIPFTTALDAFGGTGSVAYALKCAGKLVTYNDILAFNHQIGLALIENDSVVLSDEKINSIGERESGVTYDDFIERTFEGIYFTAEENCWLDVAVQNIHRLTCPYERAIAWFALFQSAMAKRPYNLFHRRNLYMRLANVKRSFGNKTSWDRPFDVHFKVFAQNANQALIDSSGACRAVCRDALDVEPDYDLVYIDTPYINRAGVGVDYHGFYHFLEGMMAYDRWPELIDYRTKHRRLIPRESPWSRPNSSPELFRALFNHFRNSTLVVSYRSDGTPTVNQLEKLLWSIKTSVRICDAVPHPYALSKNRWSNEVLIVAV